MLKKLLPDEYVASVFDINLERLKEKGIEGLVIDIDNTLVSWDTKSADHRVLDWFAKLERLGFNVCLLSNNTKDRVTKFTELMGVPAVYRAAKPGKRAFEKAMAVMGKKRSKSAVVGDQVFTDIFGGKRLGLYSILVIPIDKREFITTRLLRKIEGVFINRMVKEGRLIKPINRHGN